MPRAKQRTPELRDHVLRVAVLVLTNQGPAGFTTRKVAEEAKTSTPAVYELFGDKAGLVREIFFEGFRALGGALDQIPETADPRANLENTLHAFRVFIRKNAALSEVMFSRPFSDFDPGPAEMKAGARVRRCIVLRVKRCVSAGLLVGDETDVAHVLVSLTQGLAATEAAGWLGSSKASIERRWRLAIRAVLDGLEPAPLKRARRAAT
jgi:AcrR family transcriptional regulator